MARRRREDGKKEDEEEVFRMPEFDEKEYIEKEIEKSKASIGIVFLAILFSIISTLTFSYSLSWPLSAAIGLLGYALFKFIYPMFKVDPSVLEKKDYVGHVFIYFFTWLAVFILLINTPFMDLTSPQISDIHIEGMDQNGTWMPYEDAENATQYRIVATVTDNSGIASVEILVPGNSTWRDMGALGGGRYGLQIPEPSVGDVFRIRATDVNGHTSEKVWVVG